jgi:RNA polymerase sigma-70 factor (ECF subfamily)
MVGQFEKYSEAEIVKRVLQGEKMLYEIIVRRFNPSLYKIGRSYNYNHEDTRDLMQDSFVDAYKNLAQFKGHSDFKTWIIRIMLNNCWRKNKKSSFKNEMAKEISDNSKPVFAGADNDTEKIVQNREMKHIIENTLAKIPQDYRIVFSLREINELSVSETAALLEVSEANVKVRLNRAKAMLRNEIEKSYTASELFEFNLVHCDAVVENVMKKIDAL